MWTDGEHSSIREWKVTSELADDGVTHTATHVHATDKRGRVHELDADVFRVSPGPAGIRPDSTIVNEGLARWTYEGRTGYGISEYLHQLDANATGRPDRVVTLASALGVVRTQVRGVEHDEADAERGDHRLIVGAVAAHASLRARDRARRNATPPLPGRHIR